jgi:hypothetical protein
VKEIQMTQHTHPQSRATAGARSRRRLGTAVLAIAALAVVLAAPAAQAHPQADAGLAAAFCERFERLLDDLVGSVTAALRPERLGQKPDDEPTAVTSADDGTVDPGTSLRPERLGGKSD